MMNRGTAKTVLAGAALALALAGCASRPLARQPGARVGEASVAFKDNTDGSTRIDLTVTGLEEPERLVPPAYTYVGWVRSDENSPAQNLGPLAFDKDFRGRLQAVAPLQSFEFFVTAEATSQADQPSRLPLLWTSRNKPASTFDMIGRN